MRTFVQVSSYYFNFSVGSSAFSFDVINGGQFRRRVTNAPPILGRLRDRTSEGVVAVRNVLSQLHFDAFRSRPETSSLLPLFQLFIRVPKLISLGSRGDGVKASDVDVLKGIALRLL